MAEGKKGFILYADNQELFNELTDEQAGKLIKHILRYVNDENPVTEDPIVKISFIPIKHQLKRDLKHWESIRKSRSKAGKASAESKRLQKLTKVYDVQQTPTKSTSVESVQQTPTNPTVIVNDNVNVNVKESVINENTHPVLIGFRKNVFKEAKELSISDKTALAFFKHWTVIDHNSGKFLFQAKGDFGIQNRLKNWNAIEFKNKPKEEKNPWLQ